LSCTQISVICAHGQVVNISSGTCNCPVQIQAEPTQLLRFYAPALLNQQVGQSRGGIPVPDVGPGAKPFEVAAFGQLAGQSRASISVASVGSGAQVGQVTALGQQSG